ncbi:MAG: TIGR01244 family sulfur transferase [Robiginitomaculum sp.]|nr:TIGR01244 family sulfur transferase [Robiginitomaculum sp.]MDQ7076920.1 TIGR01244 family sulfur transferase [Robiginitomaculum sp.]
MRFSNTIFSLPSFVALLFAFGMASIAHSQAPETKDTPFRQVTPAFSVAGQLSVDDIRRAAAQGYTLVINNRPDGEGGPDQPTSAELEKAAKEVGIDYLYTPFRSGHVTDEAFNQAKMVLSKHEGKTLSFCRSGTRAITVWAMAQSALGNMPPDDAIKAARAAGYNLDRQRQTLQTLAAGKTP